MQRLFTKNVNFKGSCKKVRHRQYHVTNEIFINWYKKCTSISIFPDGPMLKEEAMLIKEWLNKDDLAALTALNGWLERFKLAYEICEMWIIDEADKIPQMAI